MRLNLKKLFTNVAKDLLVLPKTVYELHLQSANEKKNKVILGVAGAVAILPILATGSAAGIIALYQASLLTTAVAATYRAIRENSSTPYGDYIPNTTGALLRM